MLKTRHIVPSLLLIILLISCTSTKNTSGTRWYHSFNTRYNVYFNGNEAYKEALKSQQEGYKENYSEMILMYPVSSLPKDKQTTGGPFDKSIEKAVKAIKTHSIQTKPEKQAGKRNDPKYQEFMNRTEYNPFLHNAWMLMAKSEFHNGDFLQAATSFSYISRLYASQPEIAVPAKLWQVRSYSELGWFYEAEDILSKLNNDKLPKSESNWFSTVYADYLIKQKRYQDAIPYLQTAIKAEKNGLQKTREKYLLGQIYKELGQNELAYKAFGQVSSASAPYVLEFSAKIRQTEVYPKGDTTKVTKQLRKMAKSSKNKDYLDQVYYALGNIYMNIPDSSKAIASYEKGVKESTQNGLDKAFCQIKLGDIYFSQRKYIDAQPNYSEALGQLKKGDNDYLRVSKRSEILDEFVVFFEAVQLQDSLQRLSRMSEEERMVVIKKIIDDLIKKEEEEKKAAARDEFLAQQDALRSEQSSRNAKTPVAPAPVNPADASTFYFYNPQTVAIGKSSFQQKWGRRKLEDDWRRRNKTNPMADQFADMDGEDMENVVDLATDSIAVPTDDSAPVLDGVTEMSSDPKDPQFYLQQIPVTEEDIEASNLIIADGLFNMGVIYKDRLEDLNLALETFNTLDTRFPENENKLMAYYHTYLIYLRQGNKQMADLYKSKIRADFPESDLAVAMADPDYEYNLKMMDIVQDSLYRQTYQSYMNGQISTLRNNYKLVSTKYTQSKLMPKFMFLNALSFAQTNEPDTFKVLLKELIDKHPGEDVSELAGEMMKGFQRGLLLSASGDNMLARGSLFNIRFGEAGEEVADSTLTFSAETNTPYELMMVYPQGSINDNMLLYTVASFNFGNFMVNDFDLEKTTMGEVGLFHIKGFNNYDEVIQYLHMINQPEGYGQSLGQTVIVVPISMDNYGVLSKGKSLDEYMTFFEEHFSEGNRNLIDKWRLKQAEELEVISEEAEEVEDLLPEIEAEVEEEMERIEEENPVIPVVVGQDTTYVVTPETIETDTIKPIQVDTIQTVTPVPVDTVKKEDATDDKVIDTVNDIYDDASNVMDDASNTLDEITSDPIRGVKNLFKRKKSSNAIDEYVKQQEKEEKERQKQLKKEQKEKEKVAKELAKQQEKEKRELLKQQEAEEKALLKEKAQREKDLQKMKENERKQKEAEKNRIQKEKEQARKDALKAKEAERKEKARVRAEEIKAKQEARKEAQKQRDAERKAKAKAREEERKAKEQARKEAQKQKEAQRKNK